MDDMLETVTISKIEYDQLIEDSKLLCALQSHGVDNWEGWDDVMEEMYGDD